jgi:hypothetical protein
MRRELAESEWEPFLSAFTLQHDRWLVTVESLRGRQRDMETREEPLEGLVVRAGAENAREIIITVGGGAGPHQRFVIDDPKRLVVESENGIDQALEIERTSGNVVRVVFRSPIAPELVDGVLP